MNLYSYIPLQTHHFPLLLQWLSTPHVHKFWDPQIEWNEKLVAEKYRPYVAGYKVVEGQKQPIQAFVICFEEKPIGYIQLYNAMLFPREGYLLEEQLPAELSGFRLAAIDTFLGEPSVLGKGHGAHAIEQFLREHAQSSFDGCIVDPETDNRAAIRTYEKAGFVHVKQLYIGTRVLELMLKPC